MRLKALAAATALVLAAGCLMGCTKIESGYYEYGSGIGAVTGDIPEGIPSQPSSTLPVEDIPNVILDSGDQSVLEDIPLATEGGEPAAEAGTTLDLSTLIEPLALGGPWDHSTLSTEGDGYGQGTHFDELNRPRGAKRFNEEYSKYNAKAIDITEAKVITLTFDQGYENGYTAKILDTLKEKGVKATFFLVMDYAERQPELVKRMIDEGHTVGNHSWHHYSMPELSEEDARSEIMELHDYMLENYGVLMNKFRPPKGEYSELSLAVTGELGYTTVLWSFAYADWDTDNQPDPEASLQKLIDRAHPGAIYLLHSVSETNAEILGAFIDEMLAQGYSFIA